MAAASRSASGRMMFGLLPPSSSVTRFSSRPHLAAISRPTAVEPVKATLSTPGWSTSAAPVSPSPVSTLKRALGEACLERQLAEAQRGQRRLLGGLQDQRAARRERRRDLPDRHQQREVPGHDLGADADRLAQRVTEQVAAGDRDRLALDLRRPARVVAQVGDRGGDVALGRGQRLAVVERLELGELLAVGLDQLGERVHEPGALRRRDLAQRALERRAGGGDGAVDVLGAGLGDGADRLAGRRVDRLEGAPVGGLGALAADQEGVRRAGDELARRLRGQLLGGGGGHGADRSPAPRGLSRRGSRAASAAEPGG